MTIYQLKITETIYNKFIIVMNDKENHLDMYTCLNTVILGNPYPTMALATYELQRLINLVRSAGCFEMCTFEAPFNVEFRSNGAINKYLKEKVLV